MAERGIDDEDVFAVANYGEVIEVYPPGRPYPSELLLGWTDSDPLHIVISYSEDGSLVTILTAYIPDRSEWHPDFRRRIR